MGEACPWRCHWQGEERSGRYSPKEKVAEDPEKAQYVGQLNQEGVSHIYLDRAFFCSFRVWMEKASPWATGRNERRHPLRKCDLLPLDWPFHTLAPFRAYHCFLPSGISYTFPLPDSGPLTGRLHPLSHWLACISTPPTSCCYIYGHFLAPCTSPRRQKQ
jgi:hypothetical protein